MVNNQIQIEYFVKESEYDGRKQIGAKIFHNSLNRSFEINQQDSIAKLNSLIDAELNLINRQLKVTEYERVNSILIDGLNMSEVIDWKIFRTYQPFIEPNINFNQLTELEAQYPQKKKLQIPEIEYYAEAVMNGRVAEYRSAVKDLQEAIKKVDEDYKNELIEYRIKHDIELTNLEREIKDRELRKKEFYKSQENDFKHLINLKEQYIANNLNTVRDYSKLILNLSDYPSFILKQFEIDYNHENRILVVDYALPPTDSIPTLKSFKFTKGEWIECHISETQAQKNFENLMYSITLRTIYELFKTDIIGAIDSICFNGWVNGINKSTGKRENKCILSIQASKQEFQEIDLHYVDPKACFKSFKGISANKLISITPVQPIIQINRNDKRFVDSHSVTENIDNSTNLAAMDWEDFEHLIREIFEKEFSSNGGEVKVTQASRDGGVDAIAFDPDPIRGGKIVIQAKRYTNTVGVSAVRDLYGTVMNEGATKGILVTTSDYGSDSYEFAKGKPLTLLNGSNLLYLLERHGHKAKIDIEDARRLMKIKD